MIRHKVTVAMLDLKLLIFGGSVREEHTCCIMQKNFQRILESSVTSWWSLCKVVSYTA